MSRPDGEVRVSLSRQAAWTTAHRRTAGQEHGPELLQPGDVLSVAQEFGLMAGMDR